MSASKREPPARAVTRALWLLTEALPAMWLALVLAAAWMLAREPLPGPPRGAVPAVEAAERAVLPLLLSLGAAAIIRYFLRAAASDAGGPDSGGKEAACPSEEHRDPNDSRESFR